MTEQKVVMVSKYLYHVDVLKAEDGQRYSIHPPVYEGRGDRIPQPGELVFLEPYDGEEQWAESCWSIVNE